MDKRWEKKIFVKEKKKIKQTKKPPESNYLGLLLANLDTPVLLNNKASDALVSLGGVNVGKDKEDFRLVRVGNPHLGAVNDVVASLLLGAGLERKRVGSGTRLGQTKAANLDADS
jgi:hypothetical protein